MVRKRTIWKIAATLKVVEEIIIPQDGVKRKLDGVVNSVSPDKGCEVLDAKLIQE